jgi:hypothetical protein
MAIDETELTKGQIRKLNALRKSVGDTIAEAAFKKWLGQQESNEQAIKADPVAETILKALEPLAKDKGLNLGRYGYSIKRARGKGAKGFVVTRIEAE